MNIMPRTSYLFGVAVALVILCIACDNGVRSRTIPRLQRHETLVLLSSELAQLIRESEENEPWLAIAKNAADKMGLAQSKGITVVGRADMSLDEHEYIVWCDDRTGITVSDSETTSLLVNMAPIDQEQKMFEVLLTTLSGYELFRTMTREECEQVRHMQDPSDAYRFIQSVPVRYD